MSIGQDLLEHQDDDAGQLSYTDKQVNILRSAVENPEYDVNQIADDTDSHVTYVRSVLDRADPAEVQDILGGEVTQEPEQEAEPEPAQVEPTEGVYQEMVRLMEEEGLSRDEAAERLQGGQDEGAEPETEPEPEPTQAPQGQGEQLQGIPVTLMIPPQAVDQFADAVSQATGGAQQGVEIPQDMVSAIAAEFDVPEERARSIILRIGTERAEELTAPAEPEEVAQEVAEEEAQGQEQQGQEPQAPEQ